MILNVSRFFAGDPPRRCSQAPRGLVAIAVGAAALAACAVGCRKDTGSGNRPGDLPAQASGESAPEQPNAAVFSRVTDLETGAKAAEPDLTAFLTEQARSVNGRMAGLEHRFKSRASLARKVELKRRADPSVAVANIEIVDALRYTMLLLDEPRGHYHRSATEVLSALEGRDETVVRVKNYWPKGDNYSGVNVVLERETGFLWELQFHTAESSRVASEWHDSYKLLRNPELDLAQRRVIFDRMTVPWQSVPVPQGMLSEANPIHPTTRKILYPKP